MRPIDSIAPIKGTSNRAGKFRPARFSYLRIRGVRGERLKDIWKGFAEWLAKGSTRRSLKRSTRLRLHPFIMRFLFTSYLKGDGFSKTKTVNRITIQNISIDNIQCSILKIEMKFFLVIHKVPQYLQFYNRKVKIKLCNV